MKDNKRNITSVIEQEHNYLNNILDPEQFKEFKELTSELRDTWTKKQIFRTETEARFSVLQDNNYPTMASKYWQCVTEQNVFLENLMALSFDYRKNNIEIKQTHIDIKNEKNKLKKELLQIELDRKIYSKASMELTAKDRMREITMWSKLKKEFNDGTFNTTKADEHQLASYYKVYKEKAKEISPGTSQADIHNILGQLNTLERVKKSKEINKNNYIKKNIKETV
tara:strand:- start:463 stop:1137 length:675 start_codon:yes stop_codon:yes gene_type:complete